MTAARYAAAALALVLLLAACSTLRLAYDNAETYLYFRASRYLDLDAAGSEELEQRIGELLAWHRKHALPQYAEVSEEAAKRVARGLSREDLDWGADAVVAHARESLRFAAQRIAPMLDRLTPEQVAHIEERFAADNRRFAREHLSGSEEERRRRRARRLEHRLEEWVGRLSPAQLQIVRRFSERTPLHAELRARNRARLQAELIAMVRGREAQKRLPEWVSGVVRIRPEYAALLLELDATLTPAQRSRAEAKLRRYAEDFRILAGP